MTDLSAQTIVITGASDGIGAAASRQLSTSGARLILVGRSPQKTKAVAYSIGAEYHIADYTRLDDVRRLASELQSSCERIDVLANNAGGMFSGPVTTADGFEKTFQVNHLASFLLTFLLKNLLVSSHASVINTSSIAARMYGNLDIDDLNTWHGFTANRAYGNAKLANILFTKGLHERFHESGLSAVAFHPGVVATNFAANSDNYMQQIYHSVLRRFLSTPDQGGARLRHFIAGQPGETWQSGEYYISPRRIGRTNPMASDSNIIREHWQRSCAMLGIEW